MSKYFKIYVNIPDQTIILQFTLYIILTVSVTNDNIKTAYITEYTIEYAHTF